MLDTSGTYMYDHIGKRTKKTVGSTVTNYRWAGDMLMSEKTGSDTICYHYDTAGDLIAFSLNGIKYLYLKNLQNDIIGITDLNGISSIVFSDISRCSSRNS